MNDQKKRIAFYSVLILVCFTGVYLIQQIKNTPFEAIPVQASIENDSLVLVTLATDLLDLETCGEGFVTGEKAAKGKMSCKLSPDYEFGINNVKIIQDIHQFVSLKKITITFKSFFETTDPAAVYVLAIDDNKGKKNVFWDSRPIAFTPGGAWAEQQLSFTIPPEFIVPENKISIYPWNKNKKTFYIDDVQIEYVGEVAFNAASENTSEKSNLFFDFETEAGIPSGDNVKETNAHSGKKSCELSGGQEFGPSVNKKMSELGSSFPKRVCASVWVYPLTDDVNVVLTVSVVNSRKETVFWEGESSENKSFPKYHWTKINLLWYLPVEKFGPDDVLGVGVWNKGRTDLYVDDLEIIYGDNPERRGESSKIDPVSIYEKRFSAEKNKPPFRTIWIERQECGKELDSYSAGDIIIAGNFDNDKQGIDEVLCVSKNKQTLLSYDPALKQFKKIWENKNPSDLLWGLTNTYSCIMSDGRNSLAISKKSKSPSVNLLFDGKDWVVDTKQIASGISSQLKSNISDHRGQYTADKPQVLRLDRTWRFDLKLIEGDEILGNVDFKGYPEDHNPKYYEFVTLVSGHFTDKRRDDLLVFMANCADSNFDGHKCLMLDNLAALPNASQLYCFPK